MAGSPQGAGQEAGVTWWRRAGLQGLAAGYVLPLVLSLPFLLGGQLAAVGGQGRAFYLLPGFAAVGLPAAAVGAVLCSRWRSGREVARAAVGALVGGSIYGASILWWSYAHVAGPRRAVIAASGGPGLVGFWVAVGIALGAVFMFQRRKRVMNHA